MRKAEEVCSELMVYTLPIFGRKEVVWQMCLPKRPELDSLDEVSKG